MDTKISKTEERSCSGRKMVKLILPRVVKTSDFIEFGKNNITIYEMYLKAGLLFIEKDKVIISGTLSSKNASIYCTVGVPEDECDKRIDDVINLLNAILI